MTDKLGYGILTEKCHCGNKKGINQIVCNDCHEKEK